MWPFKKKPSAPMITTDELLRLQKCRRMILFIVDYMRPQNRAARKKAQLKREARERKRILESRLGCPPPEKKRLSKGVVDDAEYGPKPEQVMLALAIEQLDGREPLTLSKDQEWYTPTQKAGGRCGR